MARQFELSRLNNSTADLIQDKSLSQGFKNGGVVPGVTEHINTNAVQKIGKPSDILDKVASFRAAKMLGKKALGVVPFLGAGYAALQGDSAMAAEELGQDLTGPAGAIYEAAKPATSGPAQGTLDDRLERGQLTDEDKMQMKQEALQRIGR